MKNIEENETAVVVSGGAPVLASESNTFHDPTGGVGMGGGAYSKLRLLQRTSQDYPDNCKPGDWVVGQEKVDPAVIVISGGIFWEEPVEFGGEVVARRATSPQEVLDMGGNLRRGDRAAWKEVMKLKVLVLLNSRTAKKGRGRKAAMVVDIDQEGVDTVVQLGDQHWGEAVWFIRGWAWPICGTPIRAFCNAAAKAGDDYSGTVWKLRSVLKKSNNRETWQAVASKGALLDKAELKALREAYPRTAA